MWVNFKTALVVVLLSGLIWVFAEQAVTKSTLVTVDIPLSQSREDLLVQWVDEQGQAQRFMQVQLEVEGPSRRIQEIAEGILIPQINPLTVEQIGFQEPGRFATQDFTREVISLLNGELTFVDTDAYLPVKNAHPLQLSLRVTKLQRADLAIKVYDESGQILGVESLKPDKINAFVEPGITPDATVTLSPDQQIRAVSEIIPATAIVQLPGDAREYPVQVKLAENVESSWLEDEIPQSRVQVGYLWPMSMDGKFQVEFEDFDAVLDEYSPIKFRGRSQTAIDEFKNQQHLHLLLEIKKDALGGEYKGGRLRYHLPVGLENDIQIIDPKRSAVRFRLREIKSESAAPADPAKVIKKRD